MLTSFQISLQTSSTSADTVDRRLMGGKTSRKRWSEVMILFWILTIVTVGLIVKEAYHHV